MFPTAKIDTTNLGALGKQPSDQNFLSGVKFKFQIRKLPNVVYFCQEANIPSVNISVSITPTPIGTTLKWAGNKIYYGDLNITFMVDEDMSNYMELYRWITGQAPPIDSSEYAKMKFGDPTSLTQFGGEFSDCSLTVLDDQNNAKLNIRWADAFPISLSEVTFRTTSQDTDYKTCTAQFKYMYFTLHPLTEVLST